MCVSVLHQKNRNRFRDYYLTLRYFLRRVVSGYCSKVGVRYLFMALQTHTLKISAYFLVWVVTVFTHASYKEREEILKFIQPTGHTWQTCAAVHLLVFQVFSLFNILLPRSQFGESSKLSTQDICIQAHIGRKYLYACSYSQDIFVSKLI